jgi:hypothetical protein
MKKDWRSCKVCEAVIVGTRKLRLNCPCDGVEGYQKIIQRCQTMGRLPPEDDTTMSDDAEVVVGVVVEYKERKSLPIRK